MLVKRAEMTKPLFSIVTVTLNCSTDAIKTAKSVLNQTYTNYEYIVKDGGSIDGTIEELEVLGINVLVSKDAGIYFAMNQAMKYVHGKFICFLNAGDTFVSPNVLSDVHRKIEQKPELQFIYGDVIISEKHNITNEINRCIIYKNTLSRFYLYRKMICHQVWFLDTCLFFENFGFDEKFFFSADYDLLLKIIFRSNAIYQHIPQYLIYYKGNGITTTKYDATVEEKVVIQNIYYLKIERIIFDLLLSLIGFFKSQVIFPLYYLLPVSWRGKINGL